ncbi:hypothetical protein T06_5627 [Trichinella sp. T6]|nr:hypothetical protein T06_5627 [Trichinella sp. T6]
MAASCIFIPISASSSFRLFPFSDKFVHNKFPETCIVRVMDFVQSGQYPFQLIICSFSNLHIVHGQELAGLFVVEYLQDGEVKIAMVAQCVPIVHILVSLP